MRKQTREELDERVSRWARKVAVKPRCPLPVCEDCHRSRVVGDFLAESYYRLRTIGEGCIRCHLAA